MNHPFANVYDPNNSITNSSFRSNSELSASLLEDPLFNPKWEEQFYLRAPPNVADRIRRMIKSGNFNSIAFQWEDQRNGHFILDDKKYYMKLLDLPCILEVHKSVDKTTFYKSGDIGQMILISDSESMDPKLLDTENRLASGITPPTFEVKKRKFNKRNIVNLSEIENEIIRLSRGGLPEGEELEFVDPESVAHIVGDYYEETVRVVEATSSPTSPIPSPSSPGSDVIKSQKPTSPKPVSSNRSNPSLPPLTQSITSPVQSPTPTTPTALSVSASNIPKRKIKEEKEISPPRKKKKFETSPLNQHKQPSHDTMQFEMSGSNLSNSRINISNSNSNIVIENSSFSNLGSLTYNSPLPSPSQSNFLNSTSSISSSLSSPSPSPLPQSPNLLSPSILGESQNKDPSYKESLSKEVISLTSKIEEKRNQVSSSNLNAIIKKRLQQELEKLESQLKSKQEALSQL